MTLDELKNAANDKVVECYVKAEEHYGRSFDLPTVRFDLRGMAAGIAGSKRIRLNPTFLQNHPEDMLEQTIPHEVAHLLCDVMYPRERIGHGYRWKRVMRECFKLNPDRCHAYDVAHLHDFTYACVTCGKEYGFTKRRHFQVLRGRTYVCQCPDRGHLKKVA